MTALRKNQVRRAELSLPAPIEISNKPKLARSAGCVYLSCEVCGTGFERKASEVKRHAHSYCGRGCHGVAQRREVEVSCKVCRKTFAVKASSHGVVVCCGPECRSKTTSERTASMSKELWAKNTFARGEHSPAAKLTEAQAKAILADPRSNAEVARAYDLTRAAVRALRSGRTWKQLHPAAEDFA